MTGSYSIEAQSLRRGQIYHEIRTRFRPLLGPDGRSPGDLLAWWDQDRMRLLACQAFLAGSAEEQRFAHAILRSTFEDLPAKPGPNVFSASYSTSLLALYGDRLDPWAKEVLCANLRLWLPAGCTADFQFHGYNDNMPVMWTWALCWAGQYLNEPQWRKIGIANLRQFMDVLNRRGAPSEYGAGYSSHRVTGIAHLAEHDPDPDIRDLAVRVEARLWGELAGHWNPAVRQFCGPSLRGGPPLNEESRLFMRQVFGEAVAFDADEYYNAGSETKSMGLGAEFTFCYPYCYSADLAGATYHVPPAAAACLLHKRAPFTYRATAEIGYFNPGIRCKQKPVYGVGGVLITKELTSEQEVVKDSPQGGATVQALTTHHGSSFALGTSTHAAFQTSHAFRLVYRRDPAAVGAGACSTLLTRVVINDKIPGGRTKNVYIQDAEHHETKDNYCELPHDMGWYHCLQSGPTAVVLQSPQWLEGNALHSIRSDLYLWQGDAPVRGVYADGKRIDTGWSSLEAVPLVIDEGETIIGILPLPGRRLGSAPVLRLRTFGNLLTISQVAYEGPAIALDEHALSKLGLGFVCEVRSRDEVGGVEGMRALLEQTRMSDLLYGGRRRVHYARPDLRLSTAWCPYTRTASEDSINGLDAASPRFWWSDGTHEALPGSHPQGTPGFADWDWIGIQQGRQVETYNPID